MKILYKLMVFSMLLFAATACNDGIDSITPLAPGADETAPQITVQYPLEGTQIRVTDPVTSINIRFVVTDDIEIVSIKVMLDGAEIASFSDFKDYRRAVIDYLYENLTNGDHVLTIVAVDLDGKTTTTSINFEKVPPYQPKFAGEVFYMPFDGDYMELITQTNAGVVGTPGFANGKWGQAFAGAADTYLTYPIEGLKGDGFTAAFWYKVNATPDRAGLISISPAGEDRTKGLRFFREGSAASQRFKLNVGTGEGETWNDGGVVDVTAGDWVHLAFTVSATQTIVYINGEPTITTANTGIDWTGCELMSIGSGAPNFAYWNHLSDRSLFDEMRVFNKALTKEELQAVMADSGTGPAVYQPKYDGETFFMPFNSDYVEQISQNAATVVGNPGFADAAVGGSKSFAGAADSYLTYPTTGLLGNAFSAAFWYKPNADPDRAGILTVGPPDASGNKRTSGFRFFREGGATNQIIKLNVGTGDSDSWFDGGAAATIDPTEDEWVHLAFTISQSKCVVYINGEVVSEGDFAGVDWAGCDILSIGSGAPRFTEWGHLSDASYIDELRLFNKALTQAEIQSIISDEQ